MEKNPQKRLTMDGARQHRWILNSCQPLISQADNCGQSLVVTDEDMTASVTQVKPRMQAAVSCF